MSLTKADVEKVADLARIEIQATDIDNYAKDLSNTLDLIKSLQQAKTDDIIPMAHPLDCAQRLRADKVTETDNRETFQSLAPKTEAGLYLVPKVL